MLHNVDECLILQMGDSCSDLTCLPPICPMYSAHSSVNNIWVAEALVVKWKSILSVVPLQYKNGLECGEARPVVSDRFLKLLDIVIVPLRVLGVVLMLSVKLRYECLAWY